MDLAQLQQLVRRFVENEIDYPAFCEAFVRQFLYARHADAALEDLVNEVESICADFDEGDLSQQERRDELSVIAHAPLVSIELVGQLRMYLPLSVVSGNPSRALVRRESNANVIWQQEPHYPY